MRRELPLSTLHIDDAAITSRFCKEVSNGRKVRLAVASKASLDPTDGAS